MWLIKSSLVGLVRSQRQFSTKVGIIGVPYKYGADRKDLGVQNAPSLLRASGLIKEIVEFNEAVDIKDFGDVEDHEPQGSNSESPENMHFYDRLMPTMQRLSEKIGEVRRENRTCVTIGGDHAIAVGKCHEVDKIRLFYGHSALRFAILAIFLIFVQRLPSIRFDSIWIISC